MTQPDQPKGDAPAQPPAEAPPLGYQAPASKAAGRSSVSDGASWFGVIGLGIIIVSMIVGLGSVVLAVVWFIGWSAR